MTHTRQEFVDKYKHELAGMVVDAATAGRSGAGLALWLRNAMRALDARLAMMYDWLDAKPEPKPTNGTPVQPVRK